MYTHAFFCTAVFSVKETFCFLTVPVLVVKNTQRNLSVSETPAASYWFCSVIAEQCKLICAQLLMFTMMLVTAEPKYNYKSNIVAALQSQSCINNISAT